ncbi:uncharacterized protein LOC119048848 isoform X1 [Artibeus jamaicensis]|uniref:uncharacterized protein LOC119048848 isoform X1 n=1 Tax=Artibeus jamaicensis TaxID=9417 RepID=UPI00235AB937|nr:uncharacterized protein LOC119048848 isoform X1 [Artibeus jamaicensis]
MARGTDCQGDGMTVLLSGQQAVEPESERGLGWCRAGRGPSHPNKGLFTRAGGFRLRACRAPWGPPRDSQWTACAPAIRSSQSRPGPGATDKAKEEACPGGSEDLVEWLFGADSGKMVTGNTQNQQILSQSSGTSPCPDPRLVAAVAAGREGTARPEKPRAQQEEASRRAGSPDPLGPALGTWGGRLLLPAAAAFLESRVSTFFHFRKNAEHQIQDGHG